MNKTIPRPEFPRPDFVRKNWENLNGEWDFSFDTNTFDKKITVPFCYQSKMSGIEDTSDYDIVWYRRTFTAEKNKLETQNLLLKFGAVDYRADVWVNDVYIGYHTGGHVSFDFDIGNAIKDGENTIVVKATDYVNNDKPRGKQTWIGENFGCWYTPTTGIWQTVWLEWVGKTYLQRVKITPNVPSLSALCEFFISADEETELVFSAKTRIEGKEYRFGEQKVICCNGYGKASLLLKDFDLRRHHILWCPSHPNLIDVSITIPQEGVADEVETYFGMRSIGSQKGVFTLNGEPYYQRLVLDQGYWPDSILTPPSDEAIVADIKLTREMGFNGARKHQKIEDPRYYYWADKLGLLVWGELPSAYQFNDNAIKNSSKELIEFVERDYNHPSIVAWVPLNESWGVRDILENKQEQDYARMLTFLLKAYDPQRLVSSNDGWEQVTETDINAIHDYALMPHTTHKYDDIAKACETVTEHRMIFSKDNGYCEDHVTILSEYGGIAFIKEGEEGWGYYNKVKDVDEFIERLKPITHYLIKNKSFQGFCYTQLTDVMQEVNGLLTEDRLPKVPVEKLKDIFARKFHEI